MSMRANRASATKQQLRFLHEIENLDRINRGCLAVSSEFTETRAQWIEQQCVERGWIRIEVFEHPWGRVMYLTTRGLRLLQRHERKRTTYQPTLPMGAAA